MNILSDAINESNPQAVSSPPRPKPKPPGAGSERPIKTTVTASGRAFEMRAMLAYSLEPLGLTCPYCGTDYGAVYPEQCALCGGIPLPRETHAMLSNERPLVTFKKAVRNAY